MLGNREGRTEEFKLVTELKVCHQVQNRPLKSIVDFAFCPDTGGRFILCLVQQELPITAGQVVNGSSESSSEKDDFNHNKRQYREK